MGKPHQRRNRAGGTDTGLFRDRAGTFPGQTEECLHRSPHAIIVGRATAADTQGPILIHHLFSLSIAQVLHFLHHFFEFAHKSTSIHDEWTNQYSGG